MPKLTFVSTDRLMAALELDGATLSEAEHARLYSTLVAATHQVELLSGRFLMPRSLSIPHALTRTSTTELILDQDLLELTSITNGDGTPIPVESVEQAGSSLLYALDGYSFHRDDRGSAQPLVISGIWGWHDDWSQAWRISGDSVTGILSPFDTATLPVTDADGTDSEGQAPRFQAGQLLRLGAEIIGLHHVDAEANQLHVLRGQLGTTITTHEPGTAIRIYSAPPTSEALIVRWAVWLYQLPQHRQRTSIPAELMQEVSLLRRVSVKS